MAKPTMTYQLDAAAAQGAEGFVRLVSSPDDRTVIAHATASGVAVAGERTSKAGRARSVTVTTANTSTTVTGVLRSTDVGRPITGTGIPAATRVTAVGATTFTISAAATASATITATVDVDGLLVFPDLNPNSGSSDDVIDDPVGTVWEIVVRYPKAATPDPVYFTAPDATGSYSITGYTSSRPLDDLPPPGATNADLGGVLTGTVGAAAYVADSVTTAAIAPEAVTSTELAGEVAGVVDPLTDLTGWDNAYDYDPVAFDDVQLTKIGNRYWLTCPDPDDGPNNVANRAAAHGARYKDWGAWAADNVRVRVYWSASRPAEATPLIHVVEGTTSFGVGMWPFYDLYPAAPGATSVWLLGVIGSNNTNFPGAGYDYALLTADELAKYSDTSNPSAPVPIDLVSVGNTVTVWVDGVQIPGLSITVPVELRGSSVHGVAIDNNQLDGAGGTGGTRPADFPAACGPFSVTPVLAAGVATTPDWAGAPDVREKGATFYGPLRVEATEPAYEPGGVQPVVALRAAITDLGVVEVRDQSGAIEVAVEQDDGDVVTLGALLGRPSVGFSDGTYTTFMRLHDAGELRVTDDLVVAGAATIEGVNGATQGLRLVGKIATGLPTSGVVGDVVLVTDTGLWKLCTVTGTPGTWATIGGGGGGTVDVVSNVASARILGRTTSGSGDSEELTAAQAWTILDDSGPASAMSWSQPLTTTGYGSQTASATDGKVVVAQALALGGGLVSVYGNSGDANPKAGLSTAGLALGAGGGSATDWSLARTGAAVATMTGELRTSTAPSTGDALANKTYADLKLAKASNLSDVASAATAFANIKQAASDTATGVVELATNAETLTGTDTTRAVTPANVASVYAQGLSRAGRVWPPSPPLARTWKMVLPLSSSSLTWLGAGSTGSSAGTITTPVSSTIGTFTQAASSAGAGAEASIRFPSANPFYRASSSDVYGGFHFHAVVRYPDASYNETGASTGSWINVGLASASPPTARRLASLHAAAFNREHENGQNTDTNWQFVVNDGGATATTTDTGIAFTVGNVYEMWITCVAGATSIGWEIRDLTAATSASGSVGTDLPGSTTAIYPGSWLRTIDAVSRTIQVARIYIEADKG